MAAVVEQGQQHVSLLTKIASKYSVEPSKMLGTLKATAFKAQRDGPEVTNEQMMALLIVADQYGLNPWTKEIYAFPDKNNGIVPVVGVDGWSRIINGHAQFDGMEFIDGPNDKAGIPESIECVIYRKDRSHPTRAREYYAECKRGTGPWQSHPRRMLRHKALIQCARLAFGYTGIYDQDEAERIVEGDARVVSNDAIDVLNQQIKPQERLVSADIEVAEAKVVETKDSASAVTYAVVLASMDRAGKNVDALDESADLIGEVADEGQRAELTGIYKQRRAEASQ